MSAVVDERATAAAALSQAIEATAAAKLAAEAEQQRLEGEMAQVQWEATSATEAAEREKQEMATALMQANVRADKAKKAALAAIGNL